MISFSCPSCRKVLKVRDELAGRRGKCPACGAPVLTPAEEATRAPVGRSATMADQEHDDLPENPAPSPAEQGTMPSAASDPGMESSECETVSPEKKNTPPAELTEFLAPPQADDELGRLGPYRVLKILGHGGMGVVYLAEDPQLQRKVALKALLPALAPSTAARQRFLREARAAAGIKHDRIVTIFQVGEDRGAPYLAMEFLEGEPLDERLKRPEPLPLADALRITRQVAEGLAAAHDQGLIHRDIKPANIWLETRSESPKRKAESGPLSVPPRSGAGNFRIKILDFGLARSANEQTNITQSGAIVGTPAYMAPEQAKGEPVDARCDLFSLGALLYRMATGALPFPGTDTLAILSALAMSTPRAPRVLNPEVSPELSTLIMRLLEKEPKDRPASAHEVVDALRALSGGATGPVPILTRHKKSQKNQFWMLGGLAALAAGLALFFLLPGSGQKAPRDSVPALIPQEELALAGGGDSANSSKALVGILGKTGKEKNPLRELALSKDGTVLTSVDSLGTIDLWDWTTREKKKSFKKPFTPEVPLALASDGSCLFFMEGAKLRSWHIAEGIEEDVVGSAVTKGRKTIHIQNDRFVLVGNSLVDYRDKQKVLVKALMFFATVSPSQKFFVTGGPIKLKKFEKPMESKYQFEFLDYSQVAALKGDQGKANLTPLFTIPDREELRKNFLFSPDSRYLGTIPVHGKFIDLIDLSAKGNARLFQFKGHEQPVEDLAFHPGSRLLASCGQDQTVRFWDLMERKNLDVINLGSPGMTLTHLTFTPDGKHLAVANDHGSIYILRTPDLGGVTSTSPNRLGV